jgi:hypothetical protein
MTEHAQQAADLLGSDHPVPRLAETILAVRRQTRVCVAFTLALALMSSPDPTRSLPLTASAVLADMLLLGAWAVLRHEHKTRIRRLIATSGPDLPLIDVQKETMRLLDPRSRQRLARRLLRILCSAERWNELPTAQRPPPAVRDLARDSELVRRVAASVVADHPSARGVAMVEQLIADGYQSPLYAGNRVMLRQELGRIIYEFERSSAKNEPGAAGRKVMGEMKIVAR